MTDGTWTGLRKIKDFANKIAEPGIAGTVDSILSALLEKIADMLPTATPAELRILMTGTKEALETIERAAEIDEDSPTFAAGRLASAVDLLGYASYQTADERILELVAKQPYANILAILADKPLRNVDLAARLEKDEARTSKWLADLREAGGITSHKRGRETFNSVTPVGRLVVNKGREDMRRIPIDDCQVFDFEAYGHRSFDMSRIPTPAGTTPDEVPQLSAAG